MTGTKHHKPLQIYTVRAPLRKAWCDLPTANNMLGERGAKDPVTKVNPPNKQPC